LGEIGADATSLRRLVARLKRRRGQLHFCYEADPTEYGLYRQLIEFGHRCTVVAPSSPPGEPFKLDPARVLFALHETHFTSPPDWRLQLVQDPHIWFNWVTAAIHAALEPVAPLVN
jgi:hypothetical protein